MQAEYLDNEAYAAAAHANSPAKNHYHRNPIRYSTDAHRDCQPYESSHGTAELSAHLEDKKLHWKEVMLSKKQSDQTALTLKP